MHIMSVVSSVPGALVQVQPGTVGPPVYCFHPLGGSAAPYGGLAAHLGRDRLVLGVQAVGLSPGREPDRTVPEMARRYAAEIAVNASGADGYPTTGPMVLLGYSMGGVLAVETASLLRDRWPEPTVVLVDCDPRHSPHEGGPWHILVRQVLAVDMKLEQLAGLSRRDALILIRSVAAEQHRLPARFSLDRLDRMFEVCQHNERAAAAHIPDRYPGTVDVLRSTEGRLAATDAWQEFAREVRVHIVAADHHDVMGPAGSRHVAAHVLRLLAAGADPAANS